MLVWGWRSRRPAWGWALEWGAPRGLAWELHLWTTAALQVGGRDGQLVVLGLAVPYSAMLMCPVMGSSAGSKHCR